LASDLVVPAMTGSPTGTDFTWLKELHKNIWKIEERRPTLFQEVEVTYADYAALQKHLKDLHSDHDSPDYDGGKRDVLDVKLDFLRTLTPRQTDDDDSQAKTTILKLNHCSHLF
jgi:hypothetical protein